MGASWARLPERVTIREVGPRDGLQSLNAFVPTERKIELIDALSGTGLRRIEVTSFVSPKWIPMLADAEAVMAGIARRPGVVYSALVPNRIGAERAAAAGVSEMTVFLSASESHNRKNVNRSIAESLAGVREVAQVAATANIPLSGVISTCFGCPYEGDVAPERVLDIVAGLLDAGCRTVILGDTTGMANPRQVFELACRALDRFTGAEIGLHFHNTRGAGLANVLAGLQAGIALFDASIGGMGGCPYAPGATGNICTEDTVHMLHEMGIETGIDLDALIACARLAQEIVGCELPGQVMKAGKRSDIVGRVV